MLKDKELTMNLDKGLLRQDGKSWAEIAAQKLEQLAPEVYISVNSQQVKNYQEIFPFTKLIIDSVSCKGPLAGLLSSHLAKPENDLFLLACDMVKMDVPTTKIIMAAYAKYNEAHDFYVYKRNDEYEPLAGIYTGNGIKEVFRQFQEHALLKHSMKYILENGNTFSFDIPDVGTLTNCNSPADLMQ